MIKYFYLLLGFIFLLLGGLGAVLPILPTVPFLLVAAYFFGRGSERVHGWFINTSLYKKHLEDFTKNRSMKLSTKIVILALASAMLTIPFMITESLLVRISLVGLILIKYYYFGFKIKTIKQNNEGSILKEILVLIDGTKKQIAMSVFLRWLGLLCSVAAVTSMALILQKGFEESLSLDYLLLMGSVFLGAVILRSACLWLGTGFSHRAAAQAKEKFRHKIYKKLLILGMNYRKKMSPASLLQISVEGIEQLEVYIGGFLPQLFYSILAPLTLFTLLFFINAKVALVLLICVPLIPLCMLGISRVAKNLTRKHLGKYTDLSKDFLESLHGLTTLKIYNADGAKHKQMNESAEKFRIITMRVLKMQLGSVTLMDAIAYGGTAAGILIAINEMGKGNIPVWGVICVILLSAEFFLPLRILGSLFHASMNGIAAGEKVLALLELPEPDSNGKQFKSFDISMRDCFYSYDGSRQVLKNVSLDVPHGSFIAIVGESGSGKSTLAGILTGEHKRYLGSALVGNEEIREVDRDNIMENIILLEHNEYIFKGTVAENLRMGCPQATEQDMLDILKKVTLYDFVKARGGLSMNISEGGGNLSGGQRQRLAMARALLLKGNIYILDEATSNIDGENEEIMMDTLETMAGKNTVILITHRMALAKRAERVFVFKDGMLSGSGDHSSLYRQNKHYAKLYDTQYVIENFMEEGGDSKCAGAGSL